MVGTLTFTTEIIGRCLIPFGGWPQITFVLSFIGANWRGIVTLVIFRYNFMPKFK